MTDVRPPPATPSSSSPGSSSDSASLAAPPDTRLYEALTRALRGVEYELRSQREEVATCERLAKTRDEVTHGHAKAIRVEIDRQQADVSVLRKHVSEILALVRAPRVEARAVTNPLALSRWEKQGWGPPTPHQVLWFLMSLSLVLPLVGLAPAGSLFAKACEAIALLCGNKGIELARNFVSPQLRAKADAFDAHAIKELSAPVEAQGGPR